MTVSPKTRFNAAAINEAAPIIEAPLISWDVAGSSSDELPFRVDLNQFAEGTHAGSPQLVKQGVVRPLPYNGARKGYLTVAGHPELIRSLAPTIRTWSYRSAPRTVNESLSQLKHLFNFLEAADDILGNKRDGAENRRWQLADIDRDVFHYFSEYLRRLSLSSSRMTSIYNTCRLFIEDATGHQYLPQNPFSSEGDGENSPQYTHAQLKALLDIAKTTIRSFKKSRKEMLLGVDNTNFRRFIHSRAAGSLQFDSVSEGFPGRPAHKIFPCLRVVSAFVLLALLRSGANLQPVLSLKPKAWNQPNPFSPRHRTVVMSKNRRGRSNGPISVKIPSLIRPQFYLYKALRYYELLVTPLRYQIKTRFDDLNSSRVRHQRYVTSLRDDFWLFLNHNLELTALRENSAIRGINLIISEAIVRSPERFACLLDQKGKPIRFSSKAIRDGWFEFVLRNSRYNLVAGQVALSHSIDSPSIQDYIRHRWARKFTNDQIRKFHSAAIAVLDEDKVQFSPSAIRVVLQGENVTELQSRNRGRYGAYCLDPEAPPPHIYQPTDPGGVCPAASCDDCPYAHYFSSSLPDLIAEIEALRRRSRELPLYVWEGSSDCDRLARLEELLARFPSDTIAAARVVANEIHVPEAFRFFIGHAT